VSESEKELQTRDCLTMDFTFGVCRLCPIQTPFHRRLRQVRAPSSGQNQRQLVYLRTLLRRLHASHSLGASFFTLSKSVMHLYVFTRCNRSSSAGHGFCSAIGGILVFFWGIIQALVHIAFLVVWIVATVKAFTGVRWDIPYIGPVARRQEGTFNV
jgi:uncharacterized membrane protein